MGRCRPPLMSIRHCYPQMIQRCRPLNFRPRYITKVCLNWIERERERERDDVMYWVDRHRWTQRPNKWSGKVCVHQSKSSIMDWADLNCKRTSIEMGHYRHRSMPLINNNPNDHCTDHETIFKIKRRRKIIIKKSRWLIAMTRTSICDQLWLLSILSRCMYACMTYVNL